MRRWEKLLLAGCLLVSLLCAALGFMAAQAYTGTANATSAALSDMRVNPSQAVTWTPGPVLNSTGQPVGGGNSSLSFDGVGDYVQTGLNVNGYTAITMEAWVTPEDLVFGAQTAKGIITTRSAATPRTYLSVNMNTYLPAFNTYTTGSVAVASTVTLVQGTLHHIVGTYDGSNVVIYVDGVASAPAAQTGALAVTTANTEVGWAQGDRYWNGTIDEPRVYSRALSATEVAQHYQGVYINESGLQMYLDFDGEALDQSGNGNDGTLNGDPAYADGWASVPVSTLFNGTLSVSSRRILVNSTTGEAFSTIPDTAPATWGNYTAILAPDASIGNATVAPFLVDTLTVDVYTVHPEVDAGFNTLLYATGASLLDGHTLADGDTLTVEGVAFSWNEYTGRFEATDGEATPQTKTYDTLTALAEATYGITTGTMNVTAAVTWVTPQIDVVQTYLATGDILGAVYIMATAQLGGLGFWTLIMTGLSLAIYNYTGPEATLLAWILVWCTFSVVVHGEAVGIALILLALGGGLLIAKMLLDRRAS